MQIVPYSPQYKNDFIRLNKTWIEKYFSIEEEDMKTFDDLETLLANGAMIYFAIDGNKVLSTCMTLPLDQNTWEICKLVTDETQRGKGAGSKVFKACMDHAISHGAKKIIIVSNTMLKPALHIYRKFGFTEVPVDKTHNYARGDIQFIYITNKNKKNIKMVIKKENAKQKVFKGVNLDSLAVGEKSMVTKMNYAVGNFAETHTHPNEQCGYVISGKYELIIDEQAYELVAGDSYAIPENIPHSFRVIDGGEVVDVFTPIRKDYL